MLLDGEARLRMRTGLAQVEAQFEEAEPVLLQALASSETVGEFALSAAYELAMLYEQQHDLGRAARFYQRVVESAPSDSLAASLTSVRQVHKAEIRLMLIRSGRRQARLWLGLLGALIIGFILVVLYVAEERRPLPEPTSVIVSSLVSHGFLW